MIIGTDAPAAETTWRGTARYRFRPTFAYDVYFSEVETTLGAAGRRRTPGRRMLSVDGFLYRKTDDQKTWVKAPIMSRSGIGQAIDESIQTNLLTPPLLADLLAGAPSGVTGAGLGTHPRSRRPIDMRISQQFRDHGTPVTITPPPPSQLRG